MNHFWKTVFSYYVEFCQKIQFKTANDFLCTSLWLNKSIGTEKIFFADWFKNGIHTIADILNSDGSVMSQEEISSQFGVSLNFLNYYTIRTLINKVKVKNKLEINCKIDRPFIPYCIKSLISGIGSKPIYQLLQDQKVEPKNEAKWKLDLPLGNDDTIWKLVYKTCFFSIQDNSYIWFQFRVVHRIIGVQNLLYKTKISQTDMCRLCQRNVETINHLFADCERVDTLWNNLESWIKMRISCTIRIDKTMRILGYLQPGSEFWALNLILLSTRYYIFHTAKNGATLSIYQLQNFLKNVYLEQESVSSFKNSSHVFGKNWSVWKSLFTDI